MFTCVCVWGQFILEAPLGVKGSGSVQSAFPCQIVVICCCLKCAGPTLIHNTLWHGGSFIYLPSSVIRTQNDYSDTQRWTVGRRSAWNTDLRNADLRNADKVNACYYVSACASMIDERMYVSSSPCGGVLGCFLTAHLHAFWTEKNKTFGWHIGSHWNEREFSLPITGCCLPFACPQRPLLSPDPQTEPACAAGMERSGIHYSADSARMFQKESEVFHLLVCFNCIALLLLPKTMREKIQEAGGGGWGVCVGGIEELSVSGRRSW